MTTSPALGWEGALGMIVIIGALVAGVILYHLWLYRRQQAERERRSEE
jgi:hypothetical protein